MSALVKRPQRSDTSRKRRSTAPSSARWVRRPERGGEAAGPRHRPSRRELTLANTTKRGETGPGGAVALGRKKQSPRMEALFRWRGRVRRRSLRAGGRARYRGRVRVSAAQVLDERMPAADHLRGADAFQAAHRSRSGLQPAVIGFNRVVGVLLHDVPRLGHELVEHTRVRRGPIGRHLGRPSRRVQGPGEEPASRRQVPLR